MVYIMWSLPRGLEKMKALCEVNVAVLKNEVQIARELGELQQLQSLSMYIDCRDDNSEVFQEIADSLHYWKPAICRVPAALGKARNTLGKGFAECRTRQRAVGKGFFAECHISGTR